MSWLRAWDVSAGPGDSVSRGPSTGFGDSEADGPVTCLRASLHSAHRFHQAQMGLEPGPSTGLSSVPPASSLQAHWFPESLSPAPLPTGGCTGYLAAKG
jgi:hypothetical protein